MYGIGRSFQYALLAVSMGMAFLHAEEIDFRANLKKTKSAPVLQERKTEESNVNKFGLKKTASASNVKSEDKQGESSFMADFQKAKQAKADAAKAKQEIEKKREEKVERVAKLRRDFENRARQVEEKIAKHVDLNEKSEQALKKLLVDIEKASKEIDKIDAQGQERLRDLQDANDGISIPDYHYIMYDGASTTPGLRLHNLAAEIRNRLSK